ncbi:MAG: shikimate dehydrogenase [Planctomycetota bacterium]|nr:shikimate dehydrogenase [Planctomycetota bacterium]
MICATVGRGRHSSLLAEWKEAAEAGVELVELRIDCLRREPDLKRIMAEKYTPIVFTVRRGVDGGMWRGQEDKRQRLLREAIVAGVDYVDLEVDIADKIRRFGKTKRIVSYHNVNKTPEDIKDYADQCDEKDADVVKIATLAQTLSDASRVAHLAVGSPVPMIAIAMGDVGTFTRVLGAKYGAPFTYAGFNPDRMFAPGMLQYRDLKRDYQYDLIDKDTEVYAVIGDPIEQSLSPTVHNAAFRSLGLNKVLIPILVPDGGLGRALKDLEWIGIKAMSVTIPHKEKIIEFLTAKDGAVERTGSCNTVVFQPGKAIGYNTDYRAAMDVLEDALGGRTGDDESSPLLDKQVLILGAGGVARSLAFGLSRRGAGVTVTNRNDERASHLAEEVGCRAINWGQRASTLSDVLINATPVGMHPNVDDTPMPPAGFRAGQIVFDSVYHPENTMFLKLASERGCTTVSGVQMFIHQAAHQFKLYTGRDAPLDVMREALKRRLTPIKE